MREIKFRAWDKKYKVMRPAVQYFRPYKYIHFTTEEGYSSVRLEEGDEIYWSFGTPEAGKEGFIVMQYTGLKDANGKEIYEGDVVEYLYWGTKSYTEVKWQDDTSGFYPFADSPENCGCCGLGRNPNECTVIGNVYENPKLLGDKKNE